MSCEKNSELEDVKSVKRVRFSEDMNNVYEYESYENVRNSLIENESCTVSDEFSLEESVKDVVQSVKTADISNSNKCVPECCDNEVDDLIECKKPMTVANEPCKNDCYMQCDEFFTSYAGSDSPPSENFTNNNSDMADLNLLVRETKQMAISSPEQVKETNQSLSSEVSLHYAQDEAARASETEVSMCFCESNSIKNTVQDRMQSIKQTSHSSCFTRKRSSEGLLVERQTSKLNSCLQSDDYEIHSAVDLKNAVFSAWNKVKNENPSIKNVSFVPERKEKLHISSKMSNKKCEYRKDGRLKNFKRSAKKPSIKESEPISQKKKEDIEESKMAFQAWKKKKDELLSQRISEKCKKEEKKRLDSLMNERMRKNDAESAYLAWVYHKTAVFKMEKKKNDWFSERENDHLNDKIKRNDDAAKMYYKWLRSKIFSKKYNSHSLTEDKPPWTPPGKVNSLT